MLCVGVISSTSLFQTPSVSAPSLNIKNGAQLRAVAHLSESLHVILLHIPGLIGLIRDRYCCFSFIGLFAATRERRVTLSCSTIYVIRDTALMSLTLLVSFTVCCARWSNYQATRRHMNPPPLCLHRPTLVLGWCLVNDQIRGLWMFLAPVWKNKFFVFEKYDSFHKYLLLIIVRKARWTGTQGRDRSTRWARGKRASRKTRTNGLPRGAGSAWNCRKDRCSCECFYKSVKKNIFNIF